VRSSALNILAKQWFEDPETLELVRNQAMDSIDNNIRSTALDI
jgi:hypothetical protein